MTPRKLRAKSWLWCHQAGSHNGQYNLPAPSSITPAEAAASLGIDQLIYVCLGNEPRPPFDPHAEPLRGARSLVWSIVGDASSVRNNDATDLEPVLSLRRRFPNLSGAIMDDFFHNAAAPELARWSVDAVAGFQRRLRAAGLDLWVVTYDHLIDSPIRPWLDHCDVVTYWTWRAADLPRLPERFARLEALAPTQRKLLGCYLWDYGDNAPMPLPALRQQLDLARDWLAGGRIDGVIFLGSNLADLDIETIHYLRDLFAPAG